MLKTTLKIIAGMAIGVVLTLWTVWNTAGAMMFAERESPFTMEETVARIHTAGDFMMLMFFFVHVYLTTTGHTPFAHIKTMITGWEEEEQDN